MRRHPATLNHHHHEAGRTYSCNGYTASTEEMNRQVNLREETGVALQVCSGVSPRAGSHLLGSCRRTSLTGPWSQWKEGKREKLQMNRVLRQQYHRKTIRCDGNMIYPGTSNGLERLG